MLDAPLRRFRDTYHHALRVIGEDKDWPEARRLLDSLPYIEADRDFVADRAEISTLEDALATVRAKSGRGG
jgi:hypothetical protein